MKLLAPGSSTGAGRQMQKTPHGWRGLRIFRTDRLPNPRAQNRNHRRNRGDSINPWGVVLRAVHDQVSDCCGGVNFAPLCKFATSGVSTDETAIKLCDESNIASSPATHRLYC